MSKSKNSDNVIAVAAASAIFAIGAAIYSNRSSNSSVPPAEPEEEKKQNGAKEESKAAMKFDPSNITIESMTCPITCEIMSEPAVTAYGHLYELSAIRDWVA